MPNWCSTTVKISGKDTDKFHAFMEDAKENAFVETDFGDVWLGHPLIHAGIDKKFVSHGIDCNCRGYIVDTMEGDDGSVTYDCESAWDGCQDVFKKIRDIKGFDVTIEYFACELSNDVCVAFSREFAGGDYLVDGYAEEGSPLSIIIHEEGQEVISKEELERRLRLYFADDKADLKTLIAWADDIDTDDDEFISIHQIVFE